MVTSLLARCGAFLFALLRRYLALQSASVPAPRLRTLLVPLGTSAVLATLSVTSLVVVRLALGANAPGLGKDSDINLACS